MTPPGRSPSEIDDIWERQPDFPERPAFYRRVLDRCPTPVVVVDDSGSIVYTNEALMEMSGYSKVEGVQTSIFDYIHPDDAAWIADAFLRLTEQEPGRPDGRIGRGRRSTAGDRTRRLDHPGRGPRTRRQR